MEYEMEELVPIVAKLARKYTGCESSSVTYEKAEQLMGAVLYCIRETELSCRCSVAPRQRISAQQAYEMGAAHVEEKVKKALDLYHEVLEEFYCYENKCLYDTFIKGLPEFFKWYDSRFEPQNTILTLDYPVLQDLSEYSGVDKIYIFIRCVELEQKFLKEFPEDYVRNILSKYNRAYKEMIENLCEIVFSSAIGHILLGKSLSESDLDNEDYLQIRQIFGQNDLTNIRQWLKDTTKALIQKYYGGCDELSEYLLGSMDGILIRLRYTAGYRKEIKKYS